MSYIERMSLTSSNITEDQRVRLKQIFPEVFTEGCKVDFDRLKLTLGESIDTARERYGMNWPGKAECFRTIQQPSIATLVPVKNESVNFDETENQIIEGDNLEVLKLIQKSYMGKIKMIYIDPPYNTGNDFIYPDNYTESLETYLQYTGQIDAGGRKFSTNTEADGRFHSKWLNMMYPRLFLARNLLSDDGLICVSIDDHEEHNLRKLMDEIYGEESYIGTLTWITTTQPDNIGRARFGLQKNIEYVIVYSKCSRLQLPPFILKPKNVGPKYPHAGKYGPCRFEIIERAFEGAYARPTMQFEILGKKPRKGKQWQIGEETARVLEREGKVEVVNGIVKRAVYPEDEKDGDVGLVPFWAHLENVETSQNGKAELADILGAPHGFDTVKPTTLVMEMAKYLPKDAVVLDFFAGSGTTAHAVMKMNAEDNGTRKFILVQLPEPLDPDNVHHKATINYLVSSGKPTILTELTKERVRRAIRKIQHDNAERMPLPGNQKQRPLGFRVFKMKSSNFSIWDTNPANNINDLAKQLEMHVDHVVSGRTQDDILYEILLKSGFSLATKIETLVLAGKKVYGVQEGSMLVCLEPKLTIECIRAMADRTPKPSRVVCLDEGFKDNDQLKTNAVQTFKSKGITTFRTV